MAPQRNGARVFEGIFAIVLAAMMICAVVGLMTIHGTTSTDVHHQIVLLCIGLLAATLGLALAIAHAARTG